mmetsp:Transcript_88497/g.245840  ORF Transcript_88497/g.245840 Transcript_88497/m.245840 type:complete len:230 (-) Transcript_88497:130-819(-)
MWDAPALDGWHGGMLFCLSVNLLAPHTAAEPPTAVLSAVAAVPIVQPHRLSTTLLEEGPLAVVDAMLHVLAQQRPRRIRCLLPFACCKDQCLHLLLAPLRWRLSRHTAAPGWALRDLNAVFSATAPGTGFTFRPGLRRANDVRLDRAVHGAAPAPLRWLRRHGRVARPHLATANAVAEPPARELLAVPHVPEEENHLGQALLPVERLPLVGALAVVGALLNILPEDGLG